MDCQTITAELVREMFLYNPKTGKFRTKPRKYAHLYKPSAGYLNPNGYMMCTINRKTYRMHRLAWLYVHGELPANGLDHINGIKHDNRIANLRPADQAENGQNRRGVVGASMNKQNKRWRAVIVVNGKRIYLGSFATKEDAHTAYVKAKREMHPFCTI